MRAEIRRQNAISFDLCWDPVFLFYPESCKLRSWPWQHIAPGCHMGPVSSLMLTDRSDAPLLTEISRGPEDLRVLRVPTSGDMLKVLINPDSWMTSWGEGGKGTEFRVFSKSLWKPATWGSSTPRRLNTQIEKRLLNGKRQSIVKRQAQASSLHNRAGRLGKIPIFFAELIG